MVRFGLLFGLSLYSLVLSAQGVLPACESVQPRMFGPLFATPLVRPWGYVKSDQEPAGMLYEVSVALSELTGIAYSNQMQPYTRTVHSVKSGQVDFAMFQGGPDTYEGLTWLGTLVETEIFMVGRADAEPIGSLADLDGEKVGHIRASKYGRAFDEATNFVRVSIPEMRQGVAMLLAGRIDIMTSADITLYQTLKEMNLDNRYLKKLLTVNRISVSMYASDRTSHRELIECYRQTLDSMRDSGALRRIFYVDEIPL